MADPKFTKTTGQTGRDRLPGDDMRDTRVDQDVARSTTQDQRADVTEDAASANFLREWQQEALPTPPTISGYHLCWLSTTNQYDPIHKRIRMGYTPVKVEEVPGLETYKVHSGEHSGFVSVNEMLLFKVPMERYQQIMKHFHHDMPRDEEAAIKSRVEQISDSVVDSAGKKLISPEEGISELGRYVKVPTFT